MYIVRYKLQLFGTVLWAHDKEIVKYGHGYTGVAQMTKGLCYKNNYTTLPW